ncbi:MAG: DUF3572 domain-containing protein [Pseudomonadota bacterium]
MTPESASSIAISGLQFIAGDHEQLSRFVALTGMSPDSMRAEANSPEFMAAILNYFMGDEATLLAFTASYDLNPEDVGKAFMVFSPQEDMGI